MEATNSKINLSFMDENMNPFITKRVVISNGDTILEYRNVNKIIAEIPSNSSIRVVWTSGGYDTMEQIPLNLEPNKKYDFIFHCLDRSKVVEQTTPYIIFEEKDAEAKLKWKWDAENKHLTGNIDAKEGKIVDIGVWVDINLTNRPNSATISSTTTAASLDWSICFPPNVNLTGSFGSSSSLYPGKFDYKFEQINDSLQLAGIRKANYKEHIIDTFNKEPFQSELRAINGDLIQSNYYWPQYAIKEGLYHIKPANLPDDFIPLSLPLKVELDKVSLYEYYPPNVNDIQAYQFSILAEYYHTRATVFSIIHNQENKIIEAFTSPTGDQQYSNGYFGVFTLPANKKLEVLSYVDPDGNKHNLSEDIDYIVETKNNLNFISVRIPIDSVTVCLQYN
ncbi:MAG: hypothetical protein M9897_07480 [Brumimicrobium sp.]|nr:hypothetical protein [Brumimicrobium sp.]